MKLILIFILSIGAFASTTYVTPNFVVEKSELYCLNSDKIVIYPVGDILDGDYAQNCSYNKSTIETKLQKINEYKNSLEGKIYSFLKYLLYFILICSFIFMFYMLFLLIKLDLSGSIKK